MKVWGHTFIDRTLAYALVKASGTAFRSASIAITIRFIMRTSEAQICCEFSHASRSLSSA